MLVGILPHPQCFPWRFRGITLRDNPAGHCFVLRDLFPMRFFKLVMIVLLKIYATDKFFGKICLKTIRDIFFSDMWSAISGGTGWLKVLVGGDVQQKGKVQTFGLAGKPPSQFPPLVGHFDLPIKKTLKRVLGLFTVMILKRVS